MESHTKTRNAQRRIVDFMVDAGCDLDQIEQEYPHEFMNPPGKAKKPVSATHLEALPEKDDQGQRHKKIQKTTKRVEKPKHKPLKTELIQGHPVTKTQQPSGTLTKNNNLVPLDPEPRTTSSPLPPPEVESEQQPIEQFIFPLCINKANDRFFGYFGHSTILLSKPVIEGSYYIEVEVLSPSQPAHPKGKQFQSGVRMGLAKPNYKLMIPLGGQTSFAYKSRDGGLVHQNTCVEGVVGKEFETGDIMGIYLNMEPPFRTLGQSNPSKVLNQGSQLLFYKNGEMTCEVSNIQQDFYCFGVSLFNWANVRINLGPQFRHPPGVEFSPASQLFTESNKYIDVKY